MTAMCRQELTSESDSPKLLKQLIAEKHTFPSLVAQMALPNPSKWNIKREDDAVAMIPQMAAFKAIEDVSSSPLAAEIAIVLEEK